MDGNYGGYARDLAGLTLAGRYTLGRLVGQGGMGSVYQAADLQMSGRTVAVKVLAPHLVSDETQVARFEQEARAASQLRHPNTISVIDFGRSTEGYIYMVMEFLTGETLTSLLRRGRVETTRALYMMRQVCKSLAEAHAQGIIHRDLKPDNIFICEIYGEKDFIKVIDFGIAKFLDAGGQALTQAGKMFGTPRYISPEQAQGLPLSASSDLYALGVILFEMLAGRAPFVAEDPIAVAIKHVQEPPPSFAEVAPGSDVPEELDHLVFKLLAKTPEQRFATADEIVRALDAVMQSLGASRHGGHFTPVAAVTPARPRAVPLARKAPLSAVGNRTRSMDQEAGLAQPVERTRNLEAAQDPVEPDEERTLAIDISGLPPEEDDAAPESAAPIRTASLPPRSGTVRYAALATGLVLLALAALAVALTHGNPDSQSTEMAQTQPVVVPAAVAAPAPPLAPGVAPTAAPIAVPPAPPREQAVMVVSDPPGAILLVGEAPVGRTPYRLRVKAGDANLSARLRMDGYEDRTFEIVPDTVVRESLSELLPVKMQPKAPQPAALPATAAPHPTLALPPPPPRPRAKTPKETDWE